MTDIQTNSAIRKPPIVEHLRKVDAGTPNACWVGCAKGDPGAVAFSPTSAIKAERLRTLEEVAEIADKWPAENRAAAARARKSASEASRSFADQLDGAAMDCNAMAHEIRALKDMPPKAQVA